MEKGGRLAILIELCDFNTYPVRESAGARDPKSTNNTLRLPMNRRVKRQILIALGIFAGIILVFVLIAQFT